MKKILIVLLFLSGVNAFSDPGIIPPPVDAQFNSASFTYIYCMFTRLDQVDHLVSTVNAAWPPKWWTLQVTTTTTGAFRVALEGSLDETNWYQIAETSSAIGAATNITATTAKYVRMRTLRIPGSATIHAVALGVR